MSALHFPGRRPSSAGGQRRRRRPPPAGRDGISAQRRHAHPVAAHRHGAQDRPASASAKGEAIYKYGQIIGFASEDIAPGEWVHVHNVSADAFERDYAFCRDCPPPPPRPRAALLDGLRPRRRPLRHAQLHRHHQHRQLLQIRGRPFNKFSLELFNVGSGCPFASWSCGCGGAGTVAFFTTGCGAGFAGRGSAKMARKI